MESKNETLNFNIKIMLWAQNHCYIETENNWFHLNKEQWFTDWGRYYCYLIYVNELSKERVKRKEEWGVEKEEWENRKEKEYEREKHEL